MTSSLPLGETCWADTSIGLSKAFYIRSAPDPNQDGSPGTLADLTAVVWGGWLRDAFDAPLEIDGTPVSIATYLSGNASGRLLFVMSAAVLADLPLGTHRYLITANGTPVRSGPFVLTGAAE